MLFGIRLLFILTTAAFSLAAEAQGRPDLQDFGLGVSTVPVGTTTPVSLTGWFNLNRDAGIQAFLGVGSTSGNTGIGLGGLYKVTLKGNAFSGIHVGGGLTFGSENSTFFFDLVGNVGVHFFIPSLSHIYFTFDAGPAFQLAGPGSFNFSLSPYSTFLGASVIYMF